mmetsp:Transcript_233/g.661  ORF Transcript_233/g.661 Transcript_233/m.661 type:complete len:215 (-) Transcript_233:635-1279(-)
MRLLSWRWVPITWSPPLDTTSSFSGARASANSASTARKASRIAASGESAPTSMFDAAVARTDATAAASAPAGSAFAAFAASSDVAAEGSAGKSKSTSAASPAAATSRSSQDRASMPGLPPSRMSVPRPAMFVEMVTALRRPACAMMRPSRAAMSARALSTSWGMPSAARAALRSSDAAMEDEPTSTGRPVACMRFTSSTKAARFPAWLTKTTSG